MRVIADHIRAVSFAIADGLVPSNAKAGYVIRRILRRAIRYGYSYLNLTEPFMTKLVPTLAMQFADVFPELNAQRDFVATVIREEEVAFLRTLGSGLGRVDSIANELSQSIMANIPKLTPTLSDFAKSMESFARLNPSATGLSQNLAASLSAIKKFPENAKASAATLSGLSSQVSKSLEGLKSLSKLPDVQSSIDLDSLSKALQSIREAVRIPGETVFELNDTFGFPADLTALIAREKGLSIDEEGFQKALQEQKARSRKDATSSAGDWIDVNDSVDRTRFVGYDQTEADTVIVKYRRVQNKQGTQYQIVLAETPFYAESGGQIGDTGVLVLTTGEQVRGIGQILEATRQVDAVTQSNAAGAEQATAIGGQLLAQAGNLTSQLDRMQTLITGDARPLRPRQQADLIGFQRQRISDGIHEINQGLFGWFCF